MKYKYDESLKNFRQIEGMIGFIIGSLAILWTVGQRAVIVVSQIN